MSREYDSTYEGQLQKCGDERSALEQTVDDLSEENQQLRAELAQRTAERDEARLEIVDALKEMHTTAGLRRELKRRGWAEWYMEAKP
jgi:uncharacterized coiled-coil DUF342 family protein